MIDGNSSLLIVEDDPKLGPIMANVLGRDWDVTLVDDIASATDALAKKLYDVAIVDRRLPDGDGVELVSQMRARRDATPVLMLTALGEILDKVGGLDAGANDYLAKPFDFQEVGARLRALTRNYAAPPRGIDIGSWTYIPANNSVESPYSGRILLTEKEAALLGVLAAKPDTAFTRRQLLDAVFDRGDLEGTVDTYVHYIRRKTEKDLIETVRGVGYRLGTPV